MLIKLSPFVVLPGDSTAMSVFVTGDTITVNGVEFDFTPLPEGGELPAGAIDSEWFEGPVLRRSGRLELTLRLPLSAGASPAACFPEPLLAEADGPVELPQ